MKPVIILLFALKALCLVTIFPNVVAQSSQFFLLSQRLALPAPQSCDTDSNCPPWLACVNNTCTKCMKPTTTCTQSLWECCPGTTCEPIPDANAEWCMPNHNNCSAHTDCAGGTNCLARLGKCGFCKREGARCTLPFDDLECCSGYCAYEPITKKNFCSDHWTAYYNVLPD
jgi:hypothetical protein